MDLVHDRGSMDPVHESGPWTRSKEGVHGPLGPCFVLTRQLLPSARCQRAKHLLKKPLNSFFFTSRKSNFSVQNNVVSVCCSYLNMVFPGIGNVKYPHGRIDQQQQMSKGQILRYISLTTAYHCCHSLHAFTGSCEKFSFLRYDS